MSKFIVIPLEIFRFYDTMNSNYAGGALYAHGFMPIECCFRV